jgi:tetratricopeptide (TPR) repeat protein
LLWRAWLLALAIPTIAWRTAVRADLFTTVLFTVLVVALYNRDLKRPWLLPVLFLAWANLHPGFILGLAMLGFFSLLRPQLWRWTALSAAATLINPFGWRLYQAIWVQGRALEYQKAFIGEWGSRRLTPEQMMNIFEFRHPDSSYWFLLVLSLFGMMWALYRRQFWRLLLLAGFAAGSFVLIRFQALFVVVAVLLLPDLLEFTPRRWLPEAALAILLLMCGARMADLVTSYGYLSDSQPTAFGVGISSWPPERAVRFIRDHHLPRNVYHDYNLGGYMTWALAPEYPVFIDGRALPYGPDLFFLQQRLSGLPPAAPEWQSTLSRWKISTFLISTHRFGGYGGLPLKTFLDSPQFKLVYLDETAAVLVRAEALPPGVTALDYHSLQLSEPSTSSRVEKYNFWANAGKLYYALERDADAEHAWTEAGKLFDGDPALHLDLGQLQHARGRLPEAEQEFRQAAAMRPSPTFWYALGSLLNAEQRYGEAADCFEKAAGLAALPHQSYRMRAETLLRAGRGPEALESAEKALAANPYHGPAAVLDGGFTARATAVRGLALVALKDFPAGIASLLQAREMHPADQQVAARIQLGLAEGYLGAGRRAEARQALEQAVKMGASEEMVEPLRARLGP